MRYTTLPHTDIAVSQICLGGMTFGEPDKNWHSWTLDLEHSKAVIKHAYECGVNFIDTANVYAHGTSESYIGQALKEFSIPRDKVVLASKVFFNEGGSSAPAIKREIEGTLKRLQTDYLDLYILHRFDYETPIEETLEALHELVIAGKVRALGASEMYAYQFHNMINAAEINNWTPFSTMQCHYNLIYRENERELLPLCQEKNILPTPYSPLASGHLTHDSWITDSLRSQSDSVLKEKYDQYQEQDVPIIKRTKEIADKKGVPMAHIALAWQWSHYNMVPLVGCSSPARVDDACAALDVQLDEEEILYLEELYQPHRLVGPISRPGEKQNAGSGRAVTS